MKHVVRLEPRGIQALASCEVSGCGWERDISDDWLGVEREAREHARIAEHVVMFSRQFFYGFNGQSEGTS